MAYPVALEDIEPDHYVCWVVDLPGGFSSARDPERALARAPTRIAHYYAWIKGHDQSLPDVSGPFEVELVEEFRAHASSEDPDYLINAFFKSDRRPLSYWDVEAGLRLLNWSRQDLLKVLGSLRPESLHRPIQGEDRDSIAGVLEHVAGAENWYLDRLGLSLEWPSLPEDVFEKLEAVRGNTRTQLLRLIGEGRMTECSGERWSPRKVLRRTLWHERDHTQHIVQLSARLRR